MVAHERTLNRDVFGEKIADQTPIGCLIPTCLPTYGSDTGGLDRRIFDLLLRAFGVKL